MNDGAVDFEKLTWLRQQVGEASFADIVADFLADSMSLLDEMRAGLRDGDGEVLERAAHSLMSTSALFGATDLTAICAEIERDAVKKELDLAEPRVENAAEAFGAVEEKLRSLD